MLLAARCTYASDLHTACARAVVSAMHLYYRLSWSTHTAALREHATVQDARGHLLLAARLPSYCRGAAAA
eukprot:7764-Heterococcus_DN1.PRE.2